MTQAAEESGLDWVRRCIFVAHLPPVEFSSAQQELSTQYRVPKDHYRQSHTIERREDLPKGAHPRQVLNHSLFQVKGSEKRRGCSKLPLEIWQLENAPVVHQVHKLPADQLNWVRYAYTNTYTWEHETGAVLALWERFIDPEKMLGTSLRRKTLKRLEALAYLVMQDYKRYCNSGNRKYSNAHLQELTGISSANWSRDYTPRINRMHQILESIDKAALTRVDEVLSDVAA